MSDSSENLDVGLKQIFESLFAEKHFCMPAQVVSFDAATQTIVAQPSLKTLFQNETVPRLIPQIEDVPVVFPGGGTFFVTFDIIPGSYVLLVFAERSIENFLNLGGIADPLSTQKCDLSDAIAIPGILPLPNILAPGVDAAALTLRNKLKTSYVSVKDAAVEVNGAADFAVAYNDLKIAFDQLKTDFDALVTAYNAHIHITTATIDAGPPGVIAPTTSTGTPTTADMTPAQVPTVKLP